MLHCFILTEACSCTLELAYFTGKIAKNRLVCKNAVALAYYVILDFCLMKTRSEISHDYRDYIVFKTLHLHEKLKLAFSNSSGLKSVFEKLRLRNGLEWTAGLIVEIKQGFQMCVDTA